MCSALWEGRHDVMLREIIEDNTAGNLRITKATGWETFLFYIMYSHLKSDTKKLHQLLKQI